MKRFEVGKEYWGYFCNVDSTESYIVVKRTKCFVTVCQEYWGKRTPEHRFKIYRDNRGKRFHTGGSVISAENVIINRNIF